MRANVFCLLAASLLSTGTQPVSAQVLLTSQTRQVRAQTETGSLPEVDEHFAPNFGAWTGHAATNAASASMESEAITAARMHAVLEFGAGSRIYIAQATSLFRVEFSVTAPTAFDFSGHFFTIGQPGRFEFSLLGPQGTVFSFFQLIPADLLASGILEPGAYTFTALVGRTAVIPTSENGRSVFTLQVPTPSAAIPFAIAGALALRPRRPVSPS